MDDRVAPAAAASLVRVHSVLGCTRECSQPSVVAVLQGPEHGDLAERTRSLFAEEMDPLAAAPLTAHPRSLAAAVAAIAFASMVRRGLPLFSPPLVRAGQAGQWRIVMPTAAGLHPMAGALLRHVVEAADALGAGADPAAPVKKARAVLALLHAEAPKGKNSLVMLEVAHSMGIPWERLGGNMYRLGQGSMSRWFNSTLTDRTPAIASALAKNKQITADLLRRYGLPAPQHYPVGSAADAAAAAKRLGYPVVVKPVSQDRGVGVHAMLRTEDKVRAAFRDAAKHGLVLVEKHFVGEDYRIFVHEGEVFRIRHRVPGGVTGNGVSTVQQLLDVLNADPRRAPPGAPSELTQIPLDDEASELLAEQGLAPSDVPEADRFVRLRRIANVSVGGVPVPVDPADVHPDNLELAVRAVEALRLDLGAIDLLIPDIRRSWTETGAVICEVNAQPQWTADGAEWLYAKLFPKQGRIPVVAMITDIPPAWLNAMRRKLNAAGTRLGFCGANHMSVAQSRMATAPGQPVSASARALANDRSVQALMMVLDASVLSEGLPVDRIDLLVLAGTAADAHLRVAGAVAFAAQRIVCDADARGWPEHHERLPGEQVAHEVLALLTSTKAA